MEGLYSHELQTVGDLAEHMSEAEKICEGKPGALASAGMGALPQKGNRAAGSPRAALL